MSKGKSTIAKNIKKYRKERGLSQDKLARLADVAHATIIKIESGGTQSPTIDTIQKTCPVVSFDVLLGSPKR